MKRIIPLIAAAALSACGLDTATSAATAAALKKQELEQGKKTMDQAQQKIGKAMDQLQQSQQSRENATEN
jgi:F0F1-type ATP synthase epsilon subunit